ncbi:putative aldehyde dehydrogenase [Jaminaea rosea]|uniref:Putative aldehyde dehydrogenase n=1 Tax=Jaminaea rosea TaxID=1569628 RepID=A0A316UQW6_9BASI|nr:putative aldehyde dehydrogenase [Jaminaea rosea]PWN27690.1 putative aldehyde dehydrogenase [Jaminaea rosea]
MSTSSKQAPEPTLFIDGQWCHSSDGQSREVINPYDGSVHTYVDEATTKDAERAIESAKRFFDTSDWPHLKCADRVALLNKTADFLQRDKAILAKLEVHDTGKTMREAEGDVDDVTATFRFYAKAALEVDEEKVVKSEFLPSSAKNVIRNEPVGVCTLISPWNYPLLQICWKLAPALATGNVVIIKPSEVTPLTTIHLTKLLVEAGFPAKAVQLLTAAGSNIGDTICQHADVDLVSFTGGLATGRRIIKSCAEGVKRCCLELGGKNPNIVFADMPLDLAIDNVTTAVFLHSGQVCSSGARLIVEDSIADKLVAGVVEKAKQIKMGSGFDESTETGPLVSEAHLKKVEAYIDVAKAEGAKLLCGGSRPDPKQHPDLAKGFFFLPTVFDKCDRSMRIVQEETFGPILTVERFKDGDEAQAIYLANDTKYGLAGGVQSGDTKKAHRVARRMRHGTIWINNYGPFSPAGEWGGYGLSGNGRELGPSGLDEYIEKKHIWEETEPALTNWFAKSKL